MDTSQKKVPVQFGDGCAVSDDIAYMSAFPDALSEEAEFTRMFAFNAGTASKWFHHDLNGHRIVSVCLRQARENTPRAVCALADDGAVEIAGSAGQIFEYIAGAGLGAESKQLGYLKRIREIGGRLYACGVGNQVYRREIDGWAAIDQGLTNAAQASMLDFVERLHRLSDQVSPGDVVALSSSLASHGVLNDMAGVAEDDIYACGLNGALWHWDGTNWCRVDSGTDEHLYAMHAVASDEVWICGRNGTLLRGHRNGGFAALRDPEIRDNFWSVRKFSDRVFLGTTRGLVSLQRGAMRRVSLPGKIGFPVVQSLDSIGDTLWVFADRFLVRFQGVRWERFDHPDNG